MQLIKHYLKPPVKRDIYIYEKELNLDLDLDLNVENE